MTQDWVGTHIAGQGRCPCPGECDDSLQSHQTHPPTVHPTSRRQNNRRTAQATNVGCGGAGTTYSAHSRRRNSPRFAISWPSSCFQRRHRADSMTQSTLAATGCTRYGMACSSASQCPGSPKLSGPAHDPPGKLSRLLCHESSTLDSAGRDRDHAAVCSCRCSMSFFGCLWFRRPQTFAAQE